MRYSSFIVDGRATWGVVATDGTLVEASATGAAPASVEDHIETMSVDVTDRLRAAAERGGGVDPSTVEWLPPVRRPSKILGVAINNMIGQRLAFRPFANPAFFFKPPSSLVGHGQPVVVHESWGVTHPEPELAVVIGRRAKDVAEADALAHVFGYTIINDVTSPGLKAEDSIELVSPPGTRGGAYGRLLGWRNVRDDDHARSNYLTYHARSKGTDTFGPIGPWIVTADEIPDPNQLGVNSFDGDTAVFVDSTANLMFSVQRVIAHASAYMTLLPGDIVHCGTSMRPAEGGPFRGITDWDIRRVDGRPMRIEIDGIGALANPVVVESDR
ncbi:MAG: fumarylacetoacetate hydrolase family protein [Acidimicrobiaceae bacterium]|nr:fumarylacetoacetate hydrolase family protein [Ilumatobacter sp.]MCB9381384.1 fumarylacetoacetate hydrolase family protein [Acidimicrobiaceae bacterium]MCO5330300.1 fumarylacetoacetate hydrolase family protein [Ilumatobacteraceae bacterium]